MALTLFELLAKLSLDTSEFDKGVTSATESGKKLQQTTEKTTKKVTALQLEMATAVGEMIGKSVAGILTSIPQFVGVSIEAARELEAEMAKYSSVFGDTVGEADAAFQRLSAYSGTYYTRMRGEGMSFFTQFKASGMDSSEAMLQMESAMRLAADAAAFYDISLEDTSQRLLSFLRGNAEAGESIGLFANDVSRTNKAMELYGKKWDKLNEAQREMVMLSIAQDSYDASKATGQASREADSYANKLANVKAQWREIMAVLGSPMLDASTQIMDKLSEFLSSNPEALQDFAKGLADVADFVADLIIGTMDFVATNAEIIIWFLSEFGRLLGILPAEPGPGTLSSEKSILGENVIGVEKSYETAETDRNLNTSAVIAQQEQAAAQQEIKDAINQLLELAAPLNRPGATTAQEDAFIDAWMELDNLLGEREKAQLEKWIEDSGIAEYTEGEKAPWGGYQMPENVLNILLGIPDAMKEAVSGINIVLDTGVLVGAVSDGQARESRGKRYTGGGTSA